MTFSAARSAQFSIAANINDAEAQPIGGARVAVLSTALWRGLFGGRSVVGRSVEVLGHSYEIVGVAPPGFRGVEVDENTALWLPLGAYAEGFPDSLHWTDSRRGNLLKYVVRLRTGTTPVQAEQELSALLRASDDEVGHNQNLAASDPRFRSRLFVSLVEVTGALGPNMKPIPEARVVVWLLGMAFVLLGVACATVGSLLLLRALSRRQEIGMRLALGMRRSQLIVQLLTESVLLGVCGAALGLVIAALVGQWVKRGLLTDLGPGSMQLDSTVFAVAFACAIGSALLAGIAPLSQTAVQPMASLRLEARVGGGRRSRLQNALLSAQVALCVVLLGGAGIFVVSLQRIGQVELGLDPEALEVTVDYAGTGRSPKQIGRFYERALERVRAIPGLRGAGIAQSAPLRSVQAGNLRLPVGAAELVAEQGSPSVNYVSPGYFSAVGIRIIGGRDFRESDRSGPPVIVINETMAKLGWPGRMPLGECVPRRGDGACARVVGVVEESHKFQLTEAASLMYYEPITWDNQDEARVMIVRPAANAVIDASLIRRALWEIDAAIPFIEVDRVGAPLEAQIRPWRLGAQWFSLFGLVALLMAMTGLYSAIAFSVMQRTREIGIRVAVGASRMAVVVLILRDGVRIAAAGVSVGGIVFLLVMRRAGELVFGSSGHDWIVAVPIAALVLTVSVAASMIALRRAVLVDPAVAMRAE